MRLLVTGGAGFIGSNFVHHWVRAHPGDQVVVYDALTYAGNRSSLADIDGAIDFVHADVADAEAAARALREHRIDAVVHFAAESHNSRAALDPGLFFRTNVIGTQTMLEAARRHGVERFHHISTCEVYGEMALDDPAGFTESSPYRPRTPYSASKAGADHAVRAYAETFGLPVTITNCANNYGPYQFPEKLVALCATRALDDRPLPCTPRSTTSASGSQVLDHCRAIEAVLLRGRIGETYLVGSGRRGDHRGDRGPRARGSRKPGVAEGDRPGPARTRHPLPARLLQAARRAGLGARDRPRGGDRPHRRLVRGRTAAWWEPLLAAAPSTSTPGRTGLRAPGEHSPARPVASRASP